MLSHSPSQARSWAWPLLIVLFAFWTWLAGKDMSWDVLNHHLYIPYAWWNGRIATDIMGAGPQIYQNPVGYLPFYAMVAADWPAWCIGLAFALLHATNGLFVWLICEELWDGQGDALKGTWLATLLALCAPAFLQFAGTSSIDPLTSSFVLCGFWMAIRSPHASHAWLCCLFSAACVGLAFALKLSNAVFVIALGVTAVAQCASNRLAWSNLTWHAVGGTTSIFLGAGWYSWTLWREFGNPVFPLMNDVFRSDFSPLGAANAERFLPNDMWDLLFRAYDMMRPQAHVYTELFSPDIRLAAAFALGALCVLTLLLRWRFTNSSREGIQPSHWTSKDWDLLTILLTSYAAWMATSGNGRYAAPLLLLVGVLASRIALKTLGSRIGSMIILAVLVIQAAMTVLFGDLRRAPEPWDSSPYYPTVYSEKLKSEPALHVSISVQTFASILTELNPNGALVNPVGQMSIDLESRLGEQLSALRNRWKNRTRALIRGLPDGSSAEDIKNYRVFIDSRLYRLGWRVLWDSCLPLAYFGDKGYVQLSSCALSEDAPRNPEWDEQKLMADKVFAALEATCSLYGPSGFPADRYGDAWQKFYANSDANVFITQSAVVAAHGRRMDAIRLGSPDDILSGSKVECIPLDLRTPDL